MGLRPRSQSIRAAQAGFKKKGGRRRIDAFIEDVLRNSVVDPPAPLALPGRTSQVGAEHDGLA